MKNQLNNDILGDVIAAVLVTFPLRFNLDRDSLNFSDELKKVSENDVYLASHTLMDIHQILGLELDYMPLTEYEKFDTIKDVVEYFYIKLMER